MAKIKVELKKINEDARLPKYETEGSAGLDLSACISEPLLLKQGEIKLIPTGIAIALPSADYVALVYARSGLAIKHGITMANSVGVIDSDYRGEIKVGVINLGSEDYTISPGERIAQLVFAPVCQAAFELVDELDDTVRGAGGFGSTGR